MSHAHASSRWRHAISHRRALLAGAVLFIACVCLPAGCRDGDDESGDLRGPDSVHWVGEWVVAEYLDADGAPCVAAIDPDSGEARVESGYTLVAIESTGTVVWLAPTTAEEWRAFAEGERAWSGDIPIDSPPERLLGWDLGGEAGPSDAVPAKWAPLPGSREWVAYFEIDVLRGSRPARLLFMNSSHRDEGHRAELPADFGTFRPIGWSPTGEYFAIEELARVEADSEMSADEVTRMTRAAGRDALVIEAASGAVVASATIDAYATSSVEWLGYEEALIWLMTGSEIGTETATGAMHFRPRADLGVEAVPLDFETAESGFAAAELFPTAAGLMLRARSEETDEVWRLDRAGPERVVLVDGATSIAPSGSAAVAVLRLEESDGRSTPVVSIVYGPSSPSFGQTETEIWRGPSRRVSSAD